MGKRKKMESMVIKIKNNRWHLRNVFITGITGFLGSYIAEELMNLGANVVGLIRDYVPKSRYYIDRINEKVTSIKGSICDYQLLLRILNEYEIDTVFHLAAQTIVGIANRSPLSTFESNIKGTWSILEACRKSDFIEEIIVASTDKAYGPKKNLPYFENDPLNAEHPYDVSKAITDLLAKSYYKTYNLPIGITRCGNLYGGGDLNFNRLIPGTIRSVYYGKNPVIRSNGKFLRDYFFVVDAAKAYIILAENLKSKNLEGEAFNFGTGEPKTKPVILNKAKNEIQDQYLSCKKAKEKINWTYKYSLEEGLTSTYKWYENWFNYKQN